MSSIITIDCLLKSGTFGVNRFICFLGSKGLYFANSSEYFELKSSPVCLLCPFRRRWRVWEFFTKYSLKISFVSLKCTKYHICLMLMHPEYKMFFGGSWSSIGFSKPLCIHRSLESKLTLKPRHNSDYSFVSISSRRHRNRMGIHSSRWFTLRKSPIWVETGNQFGIHICKNIIPNLRNVPRNEIYLIINVFFLESPGRIHWRVIIAFSSFNSIRSLIWRENPNKRMKVFIRFQWIDICELRLRKIYILCSMFKDW